MPYTRLGLIATGIVKAGIVCDVEAGTMIHIACNATYADYERELKHYIQLQLSCNIEERKAFEAIYAQLAARYEPYVTRRKLSSARRKKIFELINNPRLSDHQPKGCGAYRDGWSVTMLLDGDGVPPKELGPFSKLSPEGTKTVAEQIIEYVSGKDALFFW